MTGLGRERLSLWYDVDCLFVCVWVCLGVFSREWVPRVYLRPSDLCVCRVGTPPAR